MDEEALLEWLGGKSYRRLKFKNRTRKIQERADDDNGNDDKSSAAFIPMEDVSRRYVKIKGQEESKALNKSIRDSLKPRSEAKVESSQPEFEEDAPMEQISREYLKVKKQKDSRETQRKIRESIDPDAPSLKKKKEEQQEAAMDAPVKEYEEQKEHYEKLKRNKQIKEQLEKQDPDYKPTEAQKRRDKQAEVDARLKRGPTTDSEVEGIGGSNVAKRSSNTSPVREPVAPQLTALQPPGSNNFQPEAPIVEKASFTPEAVEPEAPNVNQAPAARVPSLVGQLPPTELQPIANVPGDYGELKGVEANDPPGSKSLPLQLDIPAGQDEPEQSNNPVFADLSADYQRAASKPISLLGQPLDPAGRAYEVADRAIAPLQLFNEGLLKAPTGFARLANFINYPLDKLAGTNAFGKNNALLNKADSFIDSLEVSRQPTNVAERAMTAIGMLAVPFPSALASPAVVGIGTSLNEGVYQVTANLNRKLAADPPVPNKYDELEPRVTSVDGKTAKDIQQKLDADARSFITKFSEANFTDTMLYTVGGLAAIAGLVKYRQHLRAPVAGRTILNPETPIVENAPQSITTAKEVMRTANQDANYVLESQARRFNDLDLVHDIPTSTRAGMGSRVESMIETGAVNTPGYSTQLNVSPKQLVDFHLKRPQQEQQDVSRAFHILDQVDSAKLVAARKAGAKEVATAESGEIAKIQQPRTVRQQIEDAYVAETGGETHKYVNLDKIRERLSSLPRQQVDDELRNFVNGSDKSANLSQIADTKAHTASIKAGAYSPAGEPFHNIIFNKLEPKAAGSSIKPVPAGHVRMYHGGHSLEGHSGKLWTTPDPEYAANYRVSGNKKNNVFYVDVPENHPSLVKMIPDEDLAAIGGKQRYGNSELPPDLAAKARPYNTSRATTSRDFMSTEPEAAYAKMPPEPDIRWAEQLLAQPENAPVVQAMKDIRTAKAKVAEATGRWDAETTSSMLSNRPNYVHRIATDDYKIVDGKTVPKTRAEAMADSLKSKQGDLDYLDVSNPELSSVLERSRVNAPNQMVDAVLANVEDLRKTAVFAHENSLRQRWFEGVLKDPTTAKSVQLLEKGDTVPKGFETASYYKDGKQVRYAVEPAVARALKFSPTTAASRYNTANMIRNTFQQATTGPVLAPFFAPTAFAMESSLISATRARGMRAGNIDAGLQAATVGNLAAPGDMFGTMAAGVGAVYRAQRADRLLQAIQKTEEYFLRYGNRSLQDLEGQMPGFVKKLSRGLSLGQDATLSNLLAENRRLYEQTAKGWALKNGALHSSQNELMRNANKFYKGDMLEAFQKQLGHDEGLGWWDWYKGFVTNIHDGPRLALVEKNRGRVADNELAYQARKASGDLGVRGAGNAETGYILADDTSKAAQIATKAITGKKLGSLLDFGYASIPYINPHMQGTTRFLEQLAKQPVTTIAGAMNSTTVPMLGSLGFAGALAASGRPEYLDYMLNKREEYKKTGYIYLPVPGRPPEDGLDIRIDPVLAPFGYPVVEAMDSVFGLRKMIAQQQNRLSPNAEQQGMISAMNEALKEAIGFGMPIQGSIALASQGIAASRNVFDSSFAMRSEQASKLGTGKNPGSALSVPMQMMLENILGATAQHAIAGMDAYASTGKKDSALGNAVKGAGFSFVSKAPLAGTLFTGKNFNESATALADNTRKLTNSGKRIVVGIQNVRNALLKSQNAEAGSGNQMPGIKMGNPGITSLPPEVQQNADALYSSLNNNGKLKGINSEKSAISTSLTGLRGINAGNISRHVLVPLKEGREIGGLGYTILNEELLKQELAKEEDSRVNPKMTPGGATRAPREAKRQRSQIVKDLVGGVPKVRNNKVESPEGQFYRPPSLKEVQALKNALNERRYSLDLEAADEYESIEKSLGIKLNDLAKKIKLTPEAEAEAAKME